MQLVYDHHGTERDKARNRNKYLSKKLWAVRDAFFTSLGLALSTETDGGFEVTGFLWLSFEAAIVFLTKSGFIFLISGGLLKIPDLPPLACNIFCFSTWVFKHLFENQTISIFMPLKTQFIINSAEEDARLTSCTNSCFIAKVSMWCLNWWPCQIVRKAISIIPEGKLQWSDAKTKETETKPWN